MISPRDVVMVTRSHCSNDKCLGQVGLVKEIILVEKGKTDVGCCVCDGDIEDVVLMAVVTIGGNGFFMTPIQWLFKFKTPFELEPEIHEKGE